MTLRHDAPMQLLKRDLFGSVTLVETESGGRIVLRDTREARWWLKWLARHLARRETRALRQLAGLSTIPMLLHSDGHQLTREWIEGEPMQRARPHHPEYFRQA